MLSPADRGIAVDSPSASAAIATGSLAERTYADLKRAIVRGELAPGSAILEGALAARFGVSKTPVREALKRLEIEGLVKVLPRVGYVVSPVSMGDVQALLELRMMLEPAGAALAAGRIQPALLAELDALARVSFAGANAENYAELLEVNTRFHLGVVRGAGNTRLTAILAPVLAEAERILHLAVQLRDASDEIIRDHVEIVQALRDRDAARARQVSERHLLASRQRVTQAILTSSGLPLLVG